MRETLGGLTVIVAIVLVIAGIALPLVVWRIKDLVLEIRNELRAWRKERTGETSSSRP